MDPGTTADLDHGLPPQHGSESPQLDAQLLLAHARHCRRIELFTSYTEEATAALRREFRELVRQRAEGAPVAYLTGSSRVLFAGVPGHPRRIDPSARNRISRTGDIRLLAAARRVGSPPVLADVGTGSGILATCAPDTCPVRWCGLRTQPAALAVADRIANGTESPTVFICYRETCWSPLPDDIAGLVLSNPPYVSESEYADCARRARARTAARSWRARWERRSLSD